MSPNSKLKAGNGEDQDMKVEEIQGSAGSASGGLVGGRPGALKKNGVDKNRRSRSPPGEASPEKRGKAENQVPPSWPAPPPGFLPERDGSKPLAWTGQLPLPVTENGHQGEKSEPTLSDVMAGINNLRVENENRLSRIEYAIQSFQQELTSLKEVMVTKQMFVQFEDRVAKLEQYGGAGESGEMKISGSSKS